MLTIAKFQVSNSAYLSKPNGVSYCHSCIEKCPVLTPYGYVTHFYLHTNHSFSSDWLKSINLPSLHHFIGTFIRLVSEKVYQQFAECLDIYNFPVIVRVADLLDGLLYIEFYNYYVTISCRELVNLYDSISRSSVVNYTYEYEKIFSFHPLSLRCAVCRCVRHCED